MFSFVMHTFFLFFTSSHFILFYLISSHFISFHLISSHFISFHLISSHFISFHLISFFFFHSLKFINRKKDTDTSTGGSKPVSVKKKPTLIPEVDPWVDYPPFIPPQFSKPENDFEEEEKYELLCQSSNLGCYIILLGKIWGRDRLDVTHGMIVSGREMVRIPLELSGLPSPKEFKDNVESLSPIQKEFASAYRSLQLSGTLFGVCVVQVKPHLEQLLGLPESSLAKELELTNEILTLFLEFGISSDLMRLGEREKGEGVVGWERKRDLIQMVSTNVGRLTMIIEKEREEILERQRKIEEARRKKQEEEERRRMEEKRRRREEERRRRENERSVRRNRSSRYDDSIYLPSAICMTNEKKI